MAATATAGLGWAEAWSFLLVSPRWVQGPEPLVQLSLLPQVLSGKWSSWDYKLLPYEMLVLRVATYLTIPQCQPHSWGEL